MHKNFFILTLILLNSAALAAPIKKKTAQTETAATPHALVTALTANTATPAQPTPSTTAKRMVSITNNIKPEMLVYKHWSGNKVPEPFAIIVDGKPLEPGKTATVSLDDDKLNVQFNYSFMMGYRKGTREVTFKVPEKENSLGMTFSWDNDHRVILDKAQAIEKREI